MSQTSTTNKVSFDGDGADNSPYSWPHPLDAEGDLKIVFKDDTTGVESAVKTLTTDYTVALADDRSSAAITYVGTDASATQTMVFYLDTAITQRNTFSRHLSIEQGLDRGTQVDLSQQEQLDRCIKVPVSDGEESGGTAFVAELPPVEGATAGDVLTLTTGKTGLEYTTSNASNATHTGQVTGSAALTVDVTAISDQTLVTAASGDMLLVEDATDGALKRIDASDLLDGAGDVVGPASAIDNAIPRYNATSGKIIQGSSITVSDTDGVAGMGTLSSGAITASNLTASEIVISDGSKGIVSAAVATYPSLTELAYVKGVTSAIQTQIDTKGTGTLSNVVEDTTPQLGGTLDTNGNAIVSASNADIDVTPNGTGQTNITNFAQVGGIQAETGTTFAPALGDEGKYITLSNAGAIAVTIPANASVAFAIGTEIHFEQGLAGAVTVGITSDTLNVNANITKVSNGQYSVFTIKKITATTWTIFGNLVAA